MTLHLNKSNVRIMTVCHLILLALPKILFINFFFARDVQTKIQKWHFCANNEQSKKFNFFTCWGTSHECNPLEGEKKGQIGNGKKEKL